MGDELPVAVTPPGLDVTVKLVIADPPLFAGALNDTTKLDAVALPALTPVGAPGGEAPAPPIIMFLIDIRLILRR
jgi:precorrin isomerase